MNHSSGSQYQYYLAQNKDHSDEILRLKTTIQKNSNELYKTIHDFRKGSKVVANSHLSKQIQEDNRKLFFLNDLFNKLCDFEKAIDSKDGEKLQDVLKALKTCIDQDANFGNPNTDIIHLELKLFLQQNITRIGDVFNDLSMDQECRDTLIMFLQYFYPKGAAQISNEKNLVDFVSSDAHKRRVTERVEALVKDSILRDDYAGYRPVSELTTQFSYSC